MEGDGFFLKQDKGLASEPTLCPFTSARSAGSCRGFQRRRLWRLLREVSERLASQSPTSAGVSTKMSVPYSRSEGIMSRNENRLNFRMTDETASKIERWYQEDNCRSKNEFIEKAVNCYADMLAAGESTTLPRAVQSAIDARLKLFEDRIASLLYKQAVEMDMAMSILLQSLNVSEEVLRQERAKSIAAVKRTNGQLRLEQKLRELESEAWQG